MENTLAVKMLNLVNNDLKATQEEMRDIDRLYINKQKQARQLKKAKAELEEIVSQGETVLQQ